MSAPADSLTLPFAWYSDEELLRRERALIFARAWQYGGRAAQVAEPGSYLATDAGGVPILITRDREGSLRAFVNVCRHRGAVLMDGVQIGRGAVVRRAILDKGVSVPDGAHIGAVRDEGLDDFGMALRSGPHEGRLPFAGFRRVEVRSAGDQQVDGVYAACACRDHKRCLPVPAGGVRADPAGALARGARVVICGAVSQYNAEQVRGPANYLMLLVARASMTGMLVFDYRDRYPQALVELAQWLGDGHLIAREHIVRGSVSDFPDVLLMLFAGQNTGKLILAIDHR